MTPSPQPKLLADRYRLGTLLGSGRLGLVYRGIDIATGQNVTVKHLKPEIIRSEPQRLARFERETAVLAQLNHPNIVQMYDSVREGDNYYLVLEYLDGGDLATLLREQGRLSIPSTLRLGIEIADALTRAHHVEVVHRDVSPFTIMLTGEGTPKLTDFGLAQLEGKQRVSHTIGKNGAPNYMSPEALDGLLLDERTDIWSLGVVLFEMLTGKPPFADTSLALTLMNISTRPTPDLEQLRPDAPDALIDLIYRMLAKDRDSRISSARRVGAELEMILQALENGSYTPLPGKWVSGSQRFSAPTPAVGIAYNVNLPAQSTPFIGRTQELQAVSDLLRDPAVRLLTLLGAGGIGKTRLAVAAAEHVAPAFPDGVTFVSLAPLTTAGALIQTIGHALGMDFAQTLDPRTQLLDYLRERTILLVMDSWDHMLAGLPVLAEILSSTQAVKVLATSRVKLNLQGETVLNIDGLDYPTLPEPDSAQSSAVMLFVQAAKRAQPDFELTSETLPDVVTICQIVEGMPLGIELAASCVAALSVRDIVHEMRGNLDFLATDDTGVLDRQRSLRAVFEYSWQLLTDEEREAFARIAVFRGRFTRSAGQAVTGASIRQLMALANKSLLWRDADTGAYQIHEVSRQFAEEKLIETGQSEAIRDAHSRYYLAMLADNRRDLEGRRQLEVLESIETDLENFRAAWRWAARRGLTEELRKALYAFGLYFLLRGELVAGADLFTDTVGLVRVRPHSPERDWTLGAALAWEASLKLLSARDIRSAIPVLKEAEKLLAVQIDPFHQALVYFARAFLEIANGDPVQARTLFEQSAALFGAVGENYQVAMVYANWSRTYWYRLPAEQADLPTAMRLLNEAQAALKNEPGLYAYAYILMNRAMVGSMMGEPHAEAHARESLSMYRRLRNLFGVTSALNTLTMIAMRAGRIDDARRYAAENVRVRRDIGGEIGIVSALLSIARVELAAGDDARARQYIIEAGRLAQTLGSVRYQLESLLMFAQIEADHAEIELAVRLAMFVRDSAQADAHQRDRAAQLIEHLHLWLPPDTLKALSEQAAYQRLDALMNATLI